MTIFYFGIYNPDFGRNKIYIAALKDAGHTIVECRDTSPGLSKFFSLWKKHKKIKNQYDVMIVGYPGHIVVPFAQLISKKPVIADLLGSLYDAAVNSHNPSFSAKIKAKIADTLAVKYADKILLESEAQKKYFQKMFGSSTKYEVIYTGVDKAFDIKNVLQKDRKNPNRFVVLFRGKLTPECGIMHILKAAEILKKYPDIFFRIVGGGYFLDKAKKCIEEKHLTNVEVISRYMTLEEIVSETARASVALGQFEDNPRLSRTIPHKAFEAIAMGIPYITARAEGIAGLLEDGKSCLMVESASGDDIAKKILILRENRTLAETIAQNAHRMFEENASYTKLAEKIISIAQKEIAK